MSLSQALNQFAQNLGRYPVLEHRDREDMATFAHSLGVEPEDMWSGNAQFGIRDICAALMERNAAQPEMVRLYIPCYKANR